MKEILEKKRLQKSNESLEDCSISSINLKKQSKIKLQLEDIAIDNQYRLPSFV